MELLTVSDTATMLDVSIDTVRRWEKKGLIKGFRDAKNARVFNISEVELLAKKLKGEYSGKKYEVLKANPSNFTTVELFAGGGGTALGLENAGFKHLMVNEFDKYAAATLKNNRPEWNVIHGDVHDVDFTPWAGKIDLVEGGFPCQAFSYAGNKKGFADTRGTLFHEFARAVAEIKPKVAVGENVRGLLTHENGKTLEVMLKSLQDVGYDVAYKILRAQYLDVAQKRERLILIAVRKDLNLPILFPKERNYTVSLREVIGDRPESPGMEYAPWKFEVMAKVPEGGYWRDLSDEDQRSYMKASYYHGGGKTGMARRLAWDEPSLTLTCNPAQKQTERCHPDQTRPLNVREYARIQSFPDDWEFAGSVSQQYKQIGNAVPVNLAFHVGSAVRAMLEGATDEERFEIVEPIPPLSVR